MGRDMDQTKQKKLEHLFKARSIGILGASSDLYKVSGRPLAYMLRFGYSGAIYPINPKYNEIAGQSLSNPALVKAALGVLLDSEDFDVVVPLLLMSKATAEQKAKDLLQLYQERREDKVLMVCWPEGPREWIQYLTEKGIFVSVTPTRCAQTLKALVAYADFQRRYKGGKP